MSLRTFHLIFILVAIVLCDMFGAWAFWRHSATQEGMLVAVGIVSFAIGFALIGYAIWFVQKSERAHLS